MKKLILAVVVLSAFFTNQVNAADYNNEIGNGRDNTNLVLLGPATGSSSSKIVFSEGLGRFGTYTGMSIRHNATNGDLVFAREGSTPLFSLKSKLTPAQMRTNAVMEVASLSPQAYAVIGNTFIGSTNDAINPAAFGHKALKGSNQYAIAQSAAGELRINAPSTNTINFYSNATTKHTEVTGSGDWTMAGKLNVRNTIAATTGEFTSLKVAGATLNPASFLVNEVASVDNLKDARVVASSYSTYIGVGAGAIGGSGMHNTALGHNALSKSSAPSYNTAIGSHALSLLASGQFNTAVGLGALQSLAIGSQNTVIGQGAMVSATATTGSTAFGWSALYSLSSGLNNIAIGLEAGDHMRSGDNNIFIGKDVQGSTFKGTYYSVSNELNIGNTITGKLDTKRVAIGKYNPISTLDVNGSVTIRGGSPARGTILTAIDKNGTAQWSSIRTVLPLDVANLVQDLNKIKTAIGYTGVNGAPISISFNSVNGLYLAKDPDTVGLNDWGWGMTIGENLAPNVSRLPNSLMIGTNSFLNIANNYSGANILVGHNNLWGSNSDHSYATYNVSLGNDNLRAGYMFGNIALGQNSLTTGNIDTLEDNITLGNSALNSWGGGTLYGNIAIGPRAMHAFNRGSVYEIYKTVVRNSNTENNIAIGKRAYYGGSGSSNIAIGSDAYGEAFGFSNIAIGSGALYRSSVESITSLTATNSVVPVYNIAVGEGAMSYTHGHSNIALGASSGLGTKNGDIAFGRFALGRAASSAPESIIEEYNSMAEETSGYSHNIALGHGALHHSAAADNIAIGTLALSSLVVNGTSVNGSVISGSNGNIALGRFALRKNAVGAKNIVIGIESGNNIVNGDNNIIIGHHLGLANGEDLNSTLNIGGVIIGDLASGRVGIGIDKPARTLHIKDIMRLEPIAQAPVDAAMGDLFVHTSGAICFYNGDAWERMNTKGDCYGNPFVFNGSPLVGLRPVLQ